MAITYIQAETPSICRSRMRLSNMQVMRKCRPQLMEYHMESTFLGSCYAEVSQSSCARVSDASIAPLNL